MRTLKVDSPDENMIKINTLEQIENTATVIANRTDELDEEIQKVNEMSQQAYSTAYDAVVKADNNTEHLKKIKAQAETNHNAIETLTMRIQHLAAAAGIAFLIIFLTLLIK